jgi:predicted ferric reductase
MYPYVPPWRATAPQTTTNALNRRSGGLLNWDAGAFKELDYSHGLTGVDQVGNFLWVDAFAYIIAAIAIILTVLRICNMIWKQQRHLTAMTQPDRQAYWAHNTTRWWPWLSRHVVMAPLHKLKHNAGFRLSSAIDNGTLPSRMHFVMLVVYGGLNLAWCLALPWHVAESASVVAALRGRSGTLSALNLIPTILFALRSNPLIPLLQVSYDDFNLFHRWAGRISIFEAIIHTACWIHNTLAGGGAKAVADALRTEASYGYGMVGTVAFTIILLSSPSPIRHAFYETFMNVHRLCVWTAGVGVYMHIAKHGLPQLPWIHIIIIMYGSELLMRGLYIVYYNFRYNRTSRVKVEALPGEACRLTIDLVRDWHPRPGCHVHIYIPSLALWSSHPFSVAWADIPQSDSKEISASSLENGNSPASPPTRQISLVCRARTGLTRKMYEKACQSPSTYFNTFAFIEGPYGGHHSLDSFGTCILFAGGVGITHQVMYVQHLVNGYSRGTIATQKILLCWTVPDAQSLEWVRPWMDQILRMPDRKKCLRIKLFISRPKGRIENKAGDSVVMYAGRCNAATEIEREFKSRVGAMAVTVCGSGGMADSVRAATRSWVEDGSVEFIEEAFTF